MASPVPVRVNGPVRFATVSAGANHTCGLSTAGTAYCWGDDVSDSNLEGNLLGTGAAPDSGSLIPVEVAGGLNFRSLSANASHTCALTAQGTVYCWGEIVDDYRNLGPGDEVGVTTPSILASAVIFASLHTGLGLEFTHMCGVSTDGAGYCWGSNELGQLGNGTIVPSSEPQLVAGALPP